MTSSSIEDAMRQSQPGDPNCKICGGLGYVRHDLPVGHPDFGKMQICVCRQQYVELAARERLYRLSNLEAFERMTFDTFKPQGRMGLADQHIRSLEYALSQAATFAQTLSGWLFLSGSYGCGKTHLAAAIANYVVGQGVPTLFLTVPDLLDWLRFSYDSTDANFEQRFDEIRNIRLLVLDDLGTQNATAWAQEKLYQIINYRYNNKLPMVVTSNQNLDEIDGRIRSRLKDADLVITVHIYAPDYRTALQDSSEPQISSLPLLNDRTFGNFSLREYERNDPEGQRSLEGAFHAAQQFAENPRGWLVLMGDYGCGKTHLAAAIGNYRKALGEEPIFVVVPDLLDHLRAAFSPTSTVSYDRRFEEVKNAQLLILDDLGTQSASPWAREKLYQLFNYRYMARLPSVITTSSKMEDLDPRIRSRMLDSRLCDIYAILLPAYRIGSMEKPRRTTRRNTSTR
ncbi:MAG TPA: ATP-binding protein [Longilinea sp.]|nr:ATP-binding protein [Longilinea sp.]